jgi:hypothetical protein
MQSLAAIMNYHLPVKYYSLLLVLVVDEHRFKKLYGLMSRLQKTIQPALATVDIRCVNTSLRPSIPLIHDSYTETVCMYSSAEFLENRFTEKLYIAQGCDVCSSAWNMTTERIRLS